MLLALLERAYMCQDIGVGRISVCLCGATRLLMLRKSSCSPRFRLILWLAGMGLRAPPHSAGSGHPVPLSASSASAHGSGLLVVCSSFTREALHQ